MGENNSKWNIWQRINSRKTNNPIKKWEKDLNRHFSKEGIHMLTNTWKDVQYHSLDKSNQNCNELPPYTGQNVITKKSTNKKSWRGCGEKETLLHCWWECKLIQPLWKMVWRFPKKLWIKPPYDPAIPLLVIYPEETKIEKDTCIPLFIAALFRIARTWKQPRSPSTDEWIKKLWYIHTMEYYSAIKKRME